MVFGLWWCLLDEKPHRRAVERVEGENGKEDFGGGHDSVEVECIGCEGMGSKRQHAEGAQEQQDSDKRAAKDENGVKPGREVFHGDDMQVCLRLWNRTRGGKESGQRTAVLPGTKLARQGQGKIQRGWMLLSRHTTQPGCLRECLVFLGGKSISSRPYTFQNPSRRGIRIYAPILQNDIWNSL